MIDLDPSLLERIVSVFQEHIPKTSIYIYGSRVRGTARKYSDVDIMIKGKNAVSLEKLNELKEAFSSSNIPLVVDIHDWHTISDEFKNIIKDELLIISSR